jgi:hypothetical protein
MIFRSRKREKSATSVAERGSATASLDEFGDAEDLLEEIDTLSGQNRGRREPELERRILQLRHRAGLLLADRPASHPEYPQPDVELPSDGSGVPEITPEELTPEVLRAAILRSGCLLVRGLLDTDDAARMAAGIDRAFDARDSAASAGPDAAAYYEEFVADPRFDLSDRAWIGDASNIWGVDSPRVMVDLLDTFQRTGLRGVATDYLGERPAISVNKCTLRRVSPDSFEEDSPSFWHQDGAFLGQVRALNVWLSLTRCGDVAPGLDVVPRRLPEVVPTGTEGALFDWSVSEAMTKEVAGDAGIQRPTFEPGDVLLFDELFLHATAAEPGMPNTRYAVECWFFGPSAFPSDYAPLAS